jgi:orotidine-5'-phosphate decarboxylase
MNSNLIVGLDPNLDLYKDYPEFKSKKTDKAKLEFFCHSVLHACKDLVVGVKFQSAYFESYGLVGLEVLSRSLYEAKKLGLITILDAKRGDIDRTSTAYAKGFFTPGADFECDILTVNPFLGIKSSLETFVNVALEYNKGIFALVRTSNPDGEVIQNALVNSDKNLSDYVGHHIELLNKKYLSEKSGFDLFGKNYGPIGAVVGATKPEIGELLRKNMPHSWFLSPGLGTQGGDEKLVSNFQDSKGKGAWFPVSSGITSFKESEISEVGFAEGVKERVKIYISSI